MLVRRQCRLLFCQYCSVAKDIECWYGDSAGCYFVSIVQLLRILMLVRRQCRLLLCQYCSIAKDIDAGTETVQVAILSVLFSC